MDTMLPFVGLFYATQFADKVKFFENNIQLDFSFDRFALLKPRQSKLLKAIKGDFYKETNPQGEDSLFQFLIDDNLFNAASSVFVSVDKMFSAREMFKGYSKAESFLSMLTTSTLGTVIPQFIEEYGENKKLDIVWSPSHDFFNDGIPNAKISGIYMDKNGNWKVQLNLAA